VAERYGGDPCAKTSETRVCNGQGCEKDCELSAWTKWTSCSKDCDGGTKKRQKFVKKAPEGQGKCADQWDSKRLNYKECNMKRCTVNSTAGVLECNRSLDIVLLVDGSGSLGKRGWKAEIKAANYLVDALDVKGGGMAHLSVILYSGPRTWSGVRRCWKKGGEKACVIKTVTHFESNMKKVKKAINAMKWPRGSTLTSLALLKAKSELSLGRKNSQSVVIAITDGRPLSFRNTYRAARTLRKSARLIWVPVTKYAPLKYIKKWATRRWQENVIKVNSFRDLTKNGKDVVTHIIAAVCPKKDPKVKFGRL